MSDIQHCISVLFLIQLTSWLSSLVLKVFMRTSWLKHTWVMLKRCWCGIWGTNAGDKAKLTFSDSGSTCICYSHVHKSRILSPPLLMWVEINLSPRVYDQIFMTSQCVDLIPYDWYFATPRLHSKANLNSESTIERYEFTLCHMFVLKLM